MPTTQISSLSLHDALPISEKCWPISRRKGIYSSLSSHSALSSMMASVGPSPKVRKRSKTRRSEEHTSELQSPCNLVCRLLLVKKNKSHTVRHNFWTRSEVH